jgi:predicted methyltransferase
MENLITKPTELCLKLLSAYVSEGDAVVDATAGNGHDTLALAGLAGTGGKVYAFDVQETAIQNTKALLEREGFFERCQCILASHHLMKERIPEPEHGRISAVVFNLGYLPGGKKEITTKTETTISALKQALEIIRPGGVVAVTMYGGHPQGAEEKEALLSFSQSLPQKEYHALYLSLINQPNQPPELLFITKK